MQLDKAKERLRAADFNEVEGTPFWVNPGKHTAALALIVVGDGPDDWQLAFWDATTVEHE